MKLHSNILAFIVATLFIASASVPVLAEVEASTENTAPREDETFKSEQDGDLNKGIALFKQGKRQEAISFFNGVIGKYEDRFKASATHYNCALNPTEGLLYALEGANQNMPTVVLSANWANAHFLKGFALVDQGQLSLAQTEFEAAVKLSPHQPHYLSELANLYAQKSNFVLALSTYQQAEKNVEFSAPDTRTAELGRALRGEGYVLTEEGHFKEAEAAYRHALEINSQDSKTRGELEYIAKLQDLVRLDAPVPKEVAYSEALLAGSVAFGRCVDQAGAFGKLKSANFHQAEVASIKAYGAAQGMDALRAGKILTVRSTNTIQAVRDDIAKRGCANSDIQGKIAFLKSAATE